MVILGKWETRWALWFPSLREFQGYSKERGNQAKLGDLNKWRRCKWESGKTQDNLELQREENYTEKRTLENCKGSCLFSWILINKRTWRNYSKPEKESSEKNKCNSACYSHGDRNSACSCFQKTDWRSWSCIGSMLRKVLRQQWEMLHSRWALIQIHLTNHKANQKG